METYEVYFRTAGAWVRVAMEGAAAPQMNKVDFENILPKIVESSAITLIRRSNDVLTPIVVDTSVLGVSGGVNMTDSDPIAPVITETTSIFKNTFGIGNDLIRPGLTETASIIASLVKGSSDFLTILFEDLASAPNGETVSFVATEFNGTDFE